MEDCKARVLLTCSAGMRAQKRIDLKQIADRAIDLCATQGHKVGAGGGGGRVGWVCMGRWGGPGRDLGLRATQERAGGHSLVGSGGGSQPVLRRLPSFLSRIPTAANERKACGALVKEADTPGALKPWASLARPPWPLKLSPPSSMGTR